MAERKRGGLPVSEDVDIEIGLDPVPSGPNGKGNAGSSKAQDNVMTAPPSRPPPAHPISAAPPGTDESSPPEPTGPVAVGRYQLCFELAAGGMATVFLARASGPAGFEKPVALKRIHPHLAKEKEYVEMFLDEARIAARITHGNVCSVFDFGEANGDYYIAMEYLVGEPVSRVMKSVAKNSELRGADDWPMMAARIVADACEGLHAAHELRTAGDKSLNVVHRDISPQNLFITYDGGVKVVDFGIATAADRLHHTATGHVKGKFAYMAPEQIEGSQAIDRRADIWALGVVLWELLALQRLFRRPTQVDTLRAVLYDEITPPSKTRNGVPDIFDEIIAKALARQPKDRYKTARELGRDLSTAVAKDGRAFGSPELATWMENLFPGGEARKRQLLDVARLSNGPVPQLHDGDPDGDGTSATSLSIPETLTAFKLPATPKGRIYLLAAALLGSIILGVTYKLTTMGDEGQVRDLENMGNAPTGAGGAVESNEERAARLGLEAAAREEAQTELLAKAVAAGRAEGLAENEQRAEEQRAEEQRAEEQRAEEAAAAAAAVIPPTRMGRLVPRHLGGMKSAQQSPATMQPTEMAADMVTAMGLPPAEAPGHAFIFTQGGWAHILRNGRQIGTSPTTLDLPAGTHTLELRPQGRVTGQQIRVIVRPGETTRKVVALDP